MQNIRVIFLVCFLISSLTLYYNNIILAEEVPEEQHPEYVGEIFGQKVPKENYYFVRNAMIIFGRDWGKEPTNLKEFEDCIWDDLLLSFTAFQYNVIINDEEVSAEITRFFKERNVGFDWQADKDAYAKWVQKKAGEKTEPFENQARHILQIKKLRKQIMEKLGPQITITEEQARREFENERNAIGLELARFGTEKEAQDFYKKVKQDPALWEEEIKKDPKNFKQPGSSVSLAFLMGIWKIPEEALYDMMKKEAGEIYPPRSIYKGYAVFKLLGKRPANEADYPKSREGLYKHLREVKGYEAFDEWFEGLKKEANIKVYEGVGKR